MKKYYYLFATLLVCLPVACNKVNEQEENPQTPTITYIKAEGNEEATKASIDDDDATFTWNTNDRIAVWADGYKISEPLASTYNATNSATFAFTGDNVVIEDNRENFAIFPAKLVWDGSAIRTNSASNYKASGLTLTLPDSYTLEEVQGEVSPTPMIATNAKDGSLAFKALCPLLRITVVNIPKQTKRIEFDFNDVNVQGEFTLSSVSPATTAITTTDGGTGDVITVTMEGNTEWHDQLVVNLPVPAGTYGNITITAYDAVSGGHSILKLTKPIKSSAAWAPTRKSSRKMTATLPVFSVSATKKVTFAPGNLQATYNGSAWSWHFADHQYDFIGNGGESTVGNEMLLGVSPWISGPGTVDLFSFSSDKEGNYYGIHNNPDPGDGDSWSVAYYGSFKDWGTNSIDDYAPNTWRTLTGTATNDDDDEWSYLLKNRSKKFAMAVVAGVGGMIILPDVFTDPNTNTGETAAFKPYYYHDAKTDNVYPAGDSWDAMEKAGAVFLPAGGTRRANDAIQAVGDNGYYWSSYAYDTDAAYKIYFTYNDYWVRNGGYRYHGNSVRLVRDLN